MSPAESHGVRQTGSVAVVTAAAMREHAGGADEVPERLDAMWAGMERAAARGLAVARSQAQPISPSDLARVHPPAYTAALARACAEGRRWFMHPDCPLTTGTWHAVRLAAGAAADAARLVAAADGPLRCFCAIRPPGHHAHAQRAGGFCYVNNAIIAATILADGGRRVLVLDLDHHHGDGSETLVEADPRLAYGSLHEDPRSFRAFPGTGAWRHDGRVVDRPLPLGCGGARWLAAWSALLAAFDEFDPEALVLSFGSDALRGDPVGDLGLEQGDLVEAVRMLLARWPLLPLVSVLEGGYDAPALAEAVELHLLELAAQR